MEKSMWNQMQLPGPALANALVAWIMVACGKWVMQSVRRR